MPEHAVRAGIDAGAAGERDARRLDEVNLLGAEARRAGPSRLDGDDLGRRLPAEAVERGVEVGGVVAFEDDDRAAAVCPLADGDHVVADAELDVALQHPSGEAIDVRIVAVDEIAIRRSAQRDARRGRIRLHARRDWCGRDIRLDVHGQRKRPRGQVVELVRLIRLGLLLLLFDESLGKRGRLFEQRLRQSAQRLFGAHDDRAGRERARFRGIGVDARGADGHRRHQAPHLDRLPLQHVEQRAKVWRAGDDEVGVLPRRGLLAHRVVGVEQQPFAILRRRAQRGHSRRGMPRGAIAERVDRLVVAQHRASRPPAARHFVRHADRAVQRRPGVAVTGIEEVEALGDEERPPFPGELRRVGAAELVEPRLHFFRQIGVDRPRVGREEVRRVVAHLMEVDEHLRVPLAVFGHSGQRLLLRGPGPVAVHVDEVVVRAPARPRLRMLERLVVRIDLRAARAHEPLHVALAAVGVQQRIDDDHQVVQQRRGRRIAQQVAGHDHRRL